MGKIQIKDSFKYARQPFKLIMSKHIDDGAKNLFAYMFVMASVPVKDPKTKQEKDWEFFRKTTMSDLGLNRNNYAKYLKQLEDNHWLERIPSKTSKGDDFILYTNPKDHPFFTGTDKYLEIETRSKDHPTALYLQCQHLLDGYEFEMPYIMIDHDQKPTHNLYLSIDINGYFTIINEDINTSDVLNLDRVKLVWAYLWRDKFEEVMRFIRDNRR